MVLNGTDGVPKGRYITASEQVLQSTTQKGNAHKKQVKSRIVTNSRNHRVITSKVQRTNELTELTAKQVPCQSKENIDFGAC